MWGGLGWRFLWSPSGEAEGRCQALAGTWRINLAPSVQTLDRGPILQSRKLRFWRCGLGSVGWVCPKGPVAPCRLCHGQEGAGHD